MAQFTQLSLCFLILGLAVAALVRFFRYPGFLRYRTAATVEKWRQSYGDTKVLFHYLASVNIRGTKQIALVVVGTVSCLTVGRFVNLAIPVVLRNLVDDLVSIEAEFPWKAIVGFILLQHVLLSVTSRCASTLAQIVSEEIQDRIQCAAYDKVMSLSAEYHDSPLAAGGWHAVVLGGHKVAIFANQLCFDLIPSILDVAFVASAFWAICGGYMAAIVAAYLACYVIAVALFRPNNKLVFEKHFEHRGKLIAMANDKMQNWWTVWLFGRVAHEKARFRDAVAVRQAHSSAYALARAPTSAIMEGIMVVGLAVVALVVGHQIRFGSRSVGDFVMILRYWSGLTDPIIRVFATGDWMDDFFVESKKLLDILRRQPAVRDCDGAVDYQFRGGSISFENVCFSYDGKRQILDDVSFKVEAGQTVAIVGETGGGKSTILKLLCRAYDVTSGCIKIDGQDVRQVRLASLLEQISVVPQNIGVFDASLVENLKYGNFDATQDECEEACSGAALQKKIFQLPGGFNEAVGPRGAKLSGGELQRLAVARVLLRSSKIVLFDEATNSMDSETESRIQDYLRRWCVGRTVLIVAHRLATISHADLIVAVKDGRIVEAGRQAELLAKKGYYYELWDKQRLA